MGESEMKGKLINLVVGLGDEVSHCNGCNDGIVSNFEVNPMHKSTIKLVSICPSKQYDILMLKLLIPKNASVARWLK